MIEALRDERIKKLEKLRDSGIDSYPQNSKRTLSLSSARKDFSKLFKSKKKLWLAGRILSIRDQGNIIFLDLEDESGKLQAVLLKKNIKNFPVFKGNLDRGDFINVYGSLFKTKSGEISLEVKEVNILTKSLLPIPSEWYGVEDPDLRLRARYLELLSDPIT